MLVLDMGSAIKKRTSFQWGMLAQMHGAFLQDQPLYFKALLIGTTINSGHTLLLLVHKAMLF